MVVEGDKIKAYRSCYRGNVLGAGTTVGMVCMDMDVAHILKGGCSIHSTLVLAQELQPDGHGFFHDHDLQQDNCDKRPDNPCPLERAKSLLPEMR